MPSDEVIWQSIRHSHCRFMAKIETGNFCRNQYNLTGTCNRSSCPLANSSYATIKDHDGVFYLYMKTIERSYTPKNLWERLKLPRNYEMSLALIDKHLMYGSKLLKNKVKQRLTKMTQTRIRTRNLDLNTREEIKTNPRRLTKRELRREEKAIKVAQLDKAIETELLERLKKGVYDDIYNYPEDEFNKFLDKEKNLEEESEEEEEPVIEYVEGYDELEEEEDMEDFYGLPSTESSLDDESDDEEGDEAEEPVASHKRGRALESSDDNGKSKKKSKGVVKEVEQEDEDTRQSLRR